MYQSVVDWNSLSQDICDTSMISYLKSKLKCVLKFLISFYIVLNCFFFTVSILNLVFTL